MIIKDLISGQILTINDRIDAIREAKAEIDDAVNAGEDLNAIANKFGMQASKITNIQENVLIDDLPENLKSLEQELEAEKHKAELLFQEMKEVKNDKFLTSLMDDSSILLGESFMYWLEW